MSNLTINNSMAQGNTGFSDIPGLNSTFFSYIKNFFYRLPGSIIKGDVASIVIALILFFILIVLIKNLSEILLAILKRTIILIIVMLVMFDSVRKYMQLIESQGFSLSVIFMGSGGILLFGVGLYIAFRSLFRSTKKKINEHFPRAPYPGRKLIEADSVPVSEIEKKSGTKDFSNEIQNNNLHTDTIKELFSGKSLKSDKSLITVLIYLIVAQFGVFSSPTLAAPNIRVGVIFFLIFILGIILFVNKSYSDKKIGYTYLAATFTVGLCFSILLGIIWGKIPFEKLFSPEFFKSDSLIALISGMSVSLFAGSKD